MPRAAAPKASFQRKGIKDKAAAAGPNPDGQRETVVTAGEPNPQNDAVGQERPGKSKNRFPPGRRRFRIIGDIGPMQFYILAPITETAR